MPHRYPANPPLGHWVNTQRKARKKGTLSDAKVRVMEGVGFGTRAILDAFKAAGYSADEMTLGGGASGSDLWLQIHADTSGIPVRVPASPDAPSIGSAVLAAYGSGHYASIDEGISQMVAAGRTIDPIAVNVAQYEEVYARYKSLYPALKSCLG